MDKDPFRGSNNGNTSNSTGRERTGGYASLLRATSDTTTATATTTTTTTNNNTQQTTSEFVLQWGNRKRLRCMKVQVKDDSTGPAHRTTVRVVRTDKDPSNQPSTATTNNNTNTNHNGNGYFNLRKRPSSSPPPPPPPPPQRILRNSENSSAMRGQSNGGARGFASPDRGAHDKRGTRNNNNHHNSNNHHQNNNNDYNKSGASSETAHDSKKGGSSSASGEAAPPVWPPKFVIALTNKEKEEDFLAIKGSKLPQRPKKRAKFIQRTVNLVSPGSWLCDLTLERYEVREKKISKKRPRGLKAMGNMDSDSE